MFVGGFSPLRSIVLHIMPFSMAEGLRMLEMRGMEGVMMIMSASMSQIHSAWDRGRRLLLRRGFWPIPTSVVRHLRGLDERWGS